MQKNGKFENFGPPSLQEFLESTTSYSYIWNLVYK